MTCNLKSCLILTATYIHLLGSRVVLAKFPPQCDVILLAYAESGVNIKHCTIRKLYDQSEVLYWVITDCHTNSDAAKFCAIAHGTLAAFPEVDDKWYMHRFMSPYIVGYGSRYGCGGANNDYMYATWVGLSLSPGSSTEWVWSDGTNEAANDICFNNGITYWDKGNKFSPGSCALAASTTISQLVTNDETFRSGFYAADCKSSATAICMKSLSG